MRSVKKKPTVRKGRMVANPMTYGHLVEERFPQPKKKKKKVIDKLMRPNTVQS